MLTKVWCEYNGNPKKWGNREWLKSIITKNNMWKHPENDESNKILIFKAQWNPNKKYEENDTRTPIKSKE